MSDDYTTTCLLDPPSEIEQNHEELSGFSGRGEEHVAVLERRHRPLSMAWISDELLAETIDVWSEAYGRLVGENEAVEILMNVKRLGEVLVKARREMKT